MGKRRQYPILARDLGYGDCATFDLGGELQAIILHNGVASRRILSRT